MKFNPQLRNEIEKYKDYVILVEGAKDIEALNHFGFSRVFQIHKTGVSIRERIEEIVQDIEKKDKVCILTDLDKNGKKLYMLIKPILQEHRVKLDSSLRGILIKCGLTHIEGINTFMKKIENIY